MSPVFKRILIANRGEIAIRIARTCADMGIESLAVFAEDDSQSLHTKKADIAVPLPGYGVKAYLDIEQLIDIAMQHGCNAVHPGYGFLSENSEFSSRCAEKGITFIGPSGELLELLGNKATARKAAIKSGTPLTRGINKSCTLEEVKDFFNSLDDGAAVMIKALAGGGGRGMRPVTEFDQLERAYYQCREEAIISFGRGDLYVEQLVPRARHIEVQILGDGTGAAVHAWERECTLQRRNQKLLEIAPSPSLDNDTRMPIIEAALRLASDVKYQGLGTFEFLLDADNHSKFYFMEINPRIQVEHTITEEITGLNLVKNQILLAAGKTLAELGLEQAPIKTGCAIQARINLEKMLPDGSAKPSSGVIKAYQVPNGYGIRVDDYIYAGYRVSPSYDSLGAKVIAKGEHYKAVLNKVYRSLRELQIDGVCSNKQLLMNLIRTPEVQNNTLNTQFVESNVAGLLADASHDELFFPAEQNSASKQQAVTVPDGCEGLLSPSAGTLVCTYVAEGDEVYDGQVIATIEAMKMEIPVKASEDGIVIEVLVSEEGMIVDEGQLLVILQPSEVCIERNQTEEAIDLDYIRADLAELLERQAQNSDEYRAGAVAKRHAQGKRSTRENIADLLDEGSFNEYGAMALAAQRQKHSVDKLVEISPADGKVTGIGMVNGNLFSKEASRCAVMAYDYTVMAGSQGIINHKKTDRLLEITKKWKLPLVIFAEGAGGRPSDTDYPGVAYLNLHTFAALGELSGLVPTVSIVAGNCFAGNAALFGICDVTIATKAASIGMAGPAMIEGGGLGSFKPEEIGPVGIQSHNGVIDILVEDESEAVAVTKKYLSYFQGDLQQWETYDQRKLRHIIPENRMQVYDVREVIEILADVDSVLELRQHFAKSVITALVRIEGMPFGLFANDPRYLGGAIDADAGDKIARFIQLCDAHDIPIISLCDTPGFMVGPEAEKQATVRHISRIFVHAANMTVPMFTFVLRKGYGLGAMAMAGGGFAEPVLTASWPSGEFGAMGIEGAVRIGARKYLETIDDPQEREKVFKAQVDKMYQEGRAINTASYLELDAVIDPMESRDWLIRGLAATPKPAQRRGKKRPCIDTW
ncbi:carbamoyl-phosphate synthase large subunit [Geothermobacter hydrogeniphilus]|uniref:acetyl-CoA carboxylase n=1 Tax=Geothermobacter hydrogeniphilus TaxID=1969733 RepID=A0A2K2H5P9_9BACT|nr:carboxyl transferase domain-containing protein [Geothermobacter hydrogeniphilus]PNU18628.1 carbamoyl-phosphate synthase large subunit [Geothermobacter hydrogeniphilus]